MLQPVPDYPTAVSVGFCFSPKYFFARKENTYLSLGIPMTLGLTGIIDSASIDPCAGMMIDIPFILNYNCLFGKSKQSKSSFEYFIGGGAAYHYSEYKYLPYPPGGALQVFGFGPIANAGIRFSHGKYQIRNLEFKFSYMKMIIASKTDVFGIGLIMNL